MQSILTPDHIARLALALDTPEDYIPAGHADGILPHRIEECVALFRDIVFTGYFSARPVMEALSQLSRILAQQVCESIRIHPMYKCGNEITTRFMDQIPALRRKLATDIHAMYEGDPAAVNHEEIILCYPAINALIHYRMAHALHRLGVPILPRIITELAHAKTGIDIHPGAQIGEYFAIDHGTGVVIGETCVIGRHVRLYQGVTLGAKSFRSAPDGSLLNLPRHPILEDRVVVYSNATILGRITIGHDSIVGGNVWLTDELPPHSRVVQGHSKRTMNFIDGAGI